MDQEQNNPTHRIAELEHALTLAEQRLDECRRLAQAEVAKLEESRSEWRRQVEQMARVERLGAIGWWDADLRTGKVQWSDGMSRLLGFPAVPQLRDLGDIYAFVHPDDVPAVRRAVSEAEQNGGYYAAEFRARNLEGDEHHVRIAGEIRFEAGRPVANFGIGQDITPLKRTEAALRESERRSRRQTLELQTIYNTAPIGLCVLDDQLRFVHVNERLAEFNGLPVAEHLGRSVRDVVPAIANLGEPALRRVLDMGEPVTDLEFSGETPAQPGVRRTFVSQYWPLREDEGKVTGINVVVEEVTARRRVEEIRRTEQEFRALADNSPDFISRFDRSLRRVYANPMVARLLGRPVEVLIGKSNEDVGLSPGQVTFWNRVFERALETGETQSEESWFRTGGGECVLDSRIIPEKGPDGKVRTLLAVSRDITQRKRFEMALRESEGRYRRQAVELETIYRHAPVGLTVLDPGLRYLRINDRMAEMNGFPAAQHVGRRVGEVVPGLAPFVEQAMERVVTSGEPLLDTEVRGETAAAPGKERIWNIQWVPLKDEGDRSVWGVNVVVEEITERVRAQELLFRREQEFEALAERSPDLIARVDENMRLLYANAVVERLTGKPRSWLIGKRPSEMDIPVQEVELRERVIGEVLQSGKERSAEHMHSTPEGIRYFHTRLVPELNPEGKTVSVLIVDRDITELKRAQFTLEELTLHGPLTGAANRRYLTRFIDREWRREVRHRHSVAVVMADIDYFKAYNDHYGHQRGDECLREVAQTLKEKLRRPTDILVRYGGEEFALVLLESDLNAARQVADGMLRAVMERHLQHDASPVAPMVTISMGVCAAPAQSLSFTDLVSAADAALYRAKENGRNRVEIGSLPVG